MRLLLQEAEGEMILEFCPMAQEGGSGDAHLSPYSLPRERALQPVGDLGRSRWAGLPHVCSWQHIPFFSDPQAVSTPTRWGPPANQEIISGAKQEWDSGTCPVGQNPQKRCCRRAGSQSTSNISVSNHIL